MANNVVQLTNRSGSDNEYPIAGGLLPNSVNTGNIANNAVTSAKIDWSSIVDKIYPVGSIYMSATLSTPAQVSAALGGTWQAWGAGKVPIGVDTNDTDFDTAEEIGGDKTHRHDFKVGFKRFYGALAGDNMEEQGAWSYSRGKYSKAFGSDNITSAARNSNFATSTTTWTDSNVYSIGDTDTESSLPPYITCYMFKRIS